MDQLFSQPWLQIMALQQDTDRFPAHPRRELSLHRLLGNQPNRPPRQTRRRDEHTMAVIRWLCFTSGARC
jgi:hypothetical protein